jgi:phosphohistidine phosphatase
MPNLLIMRHGEAAHHEDDFARPLSEKGRKDVSDIAEKIKMWGIGRATIISSNSVRTKETTSILLEKLSDFSVQVSFKEDGYNAPAEVWLNHLERVNTPEFSTCIIVGHNPGVTELVNKLSGTTINMPPATCVKLNLFINDWNEISDGIGDVFLVCTP